MSGSSNQIKLGKILSSHGVKGLFVIEIYNDNGNFFERYRDKIYIKNSKVNLEKKFKKGKNYVCGSISFNSANDVSKFLGEYIWINEYELVKPKKNEFYHRDLLDCQVINFDSEVIGIVKAIHNFGAGDLLELENYQFMIRLYDIEKKNINIKKKTIRLGKNYIV